MKVHFCHQLTLQSIVLPVLQFPLQHGIRTPNEGIHQFGPMWQTKYASALKIWEWELIFGRVVKAISSPGVHNPCPSPSLFFFLNQLDNAICKHLFSQILCVHITQVQSSLLGENHV